MARVVLPHYPHHIVQRGHNRQVIFAEVTNTNKGSGLSLQHLSA